VEWFFFSTISRKHVFRSLQVRAPGLQQNRTGPILVVDSIWEVLGLQAHRVVAKVRLFGRVCDQHMTTRGIRAPVKVLRTQTHLEVTRPVHRIQKVGQTNVWNAQDAHTRQIDAKMPKASAHPTYLPPYSANVGQNQRNTKGERVPGLGTAPSTSLSTKYGSSIHLQQYHETGTARDRHSPT